MKFQYSFIALTLSLLMMSCDKKTYSYPPTYAGFSWHVENGSSQFVQPGDSVTITAVQIKKGKFLNATDYTLKFRISLKSEGAEKDSLIQLSYHTNYDGVDNGNPSFKIHVPNNTISESVMVNFSARWSNSADGQGGIFGGERTSGYLGSIRSFSYLLYSEAQGTFFLRIKQ